MTRHELLLPAIRGEFPWNDVPRLEGEPEVAIYIKPSDLFPMLQRYLDGAKDEKELQKWADWSLNLDEFEIEGAEKDDKIADYYEPMWYVLQQLSTPFVDGPITKEAVKKHVSVLSAL